MTVRKIKPVTVILTYSENGTLSLSLSKKNENAASCRCTYPSIHLVMALKLKITFGCRCTYPSIHLSLSSSFFIFISVCFSSPSLFISVSLSVSLCLPSLLSLSLLSALACGGFKKERTLCVQLSVGAPNLAIHNACHVSLFPSALFEPAQTTTVSDRPASPNFRS